MENANDKYLTTSSSASVDGGWGVRISCGSMFNTICVELPGRTRMNSSPLGEGHWSEVLRFPYIVEVYLADSGGNLFAAYIPQNPEGGLQHSYLD